MIITVHQASGGDFYQISYKVADQESIIFIDSGHDSSYPFTLKPVAENLWKNKKNVDLFVITHIDRDHIGGMRSFQKDFSECGLVLEYWFNWSPVHFPSPSKSNQVSVSDGIELRDELQKHGLIIRSKVSNAMEPVFLKGGKITVLSPDQEQFERLMRKWEGQEKEQYYSKPVQVASDSDRHIAIEELGQRNFDRNRDRTPENGSSIAFLLEADGCKGLFLGDAHPTVIVKSLAGLGYGAGNPLCVDFMTMPHHGSSRNMSNELADSIQCENYIISASGLQRPHKEALARVLMGKNRKPGGWIRFIFNHDNEHLRGIFTEEEKERHNFLCLFPQKGNRYFEIDTKNGRWHP